MEIRRSVATHQCTISWYRPLGGEPASGTTSLTLNIAEHACLALEKTVVIFSMGESADWLMIRMLAAITGVDQYRLTSGELKDTEWPTLDEAMSRLIGSNLYIDESPALNAMEIRIRSRRLKQKVGRLDLIAVFAKPRGHISCAEAVDESLHNSRRLKALATELGAPIIMLARPDSYRIGQYHEHADGELLLERHAIPTNQNDVEQMVCRLVLKQQDKLMQRFPLIYLPKTSRFLEVAPSIVQNPSV